MNLGEVGEFGLISRIAARVAPSEGVVTGIGDDAAVTAPAPGMQLLTSTDMLLEGVHFRRDWHDPYRLGRKSLAVSVSDIAAMGGIPRWALLSLALPNDLPLAFVDTFTRGFLSLAEEHGVALIGGDTCASRNGLIVSVTIMGEQAPGLIVRRSGARPGDEIWVSGTLGDAALALELLEGRLTVPRSAGTPSNYPENREENDPLLSRLLDPVPRTRAGRMLAESGLVSAMIDISDGLLADFGHIAELSAVGGSIFLDALPLSPPFRDAVQHLPDFPYHLALAGGEDYELAFTALPADRKKIADLMKTCGIDAAPVGIVTTQPDITAFTADGTHYHLPTSGFNHFIP
ncbi:thiamine-phosphate kinase [Geobacter sp. SVR]|uniref:thiamine-phosphate kinase n=1 Tax=Geobacter sp. SVR TaxID=2495594 RepID=UPI00143EF9E9|nr:thiamine-phosphate kinase [Geobacter sp. SVR]BCS55111.1 thiamine-monophosphate kinase [Geobacter sp. SVR]GCF85292.1 thiamine-monophosphate kinase [Geobacter sp. SVR]